MKMIFAMFAALALVFASTPNAYALRAYAGTQDLKNVSGIRCSSGLSCSKIKDNLIVSTGGTGALHARILASATTLTQSACGSTIYNAGAIQITLPLASANLGCRMTFVVANASNFDIRNNVADQILVLNAAAGKAARSAILGNSLIIESTAAGQWTVMSMYGTWTDIP